MKSNTQYLSLLDFNSVRIKTDTTYVTNHNLQGIQTLNKIYTYDLKDVMPIVGYTDSILAVVANTDNLSTHRSMYRDILRHKEAIAAKTDASYYVKLNTIIAGLSDSQRAILTNIEAFPALVDSIKVTDSVMSTVSIEIKLKSMASIDKAIKSITYSLFTTDIAKPTINAIVYRFSEAFAAIASHSYVASEISTMGYLHQYHLSEQMFSTYCSQLHVSNQLLAAYLNHFHLTDQLPPDYLNHFHLTDQLPPDYLNHFHLTD